MEKRTNVSHYSVIRCAICGEKIHMCLYSNYIYKLDGNYFCKYSCMQKYKRQQKKFLEAEEIEKYILNYDEEAEEKIRQLQLVEKVQRKMQKKREYAEKRKKEKKLGEIKNVKKKNNERIK